MKADQQLLAKARKLIILAVLIAAVGLFFSGWDIFRKFDGQSQFPAEEGKAYPKLPQLASYPEPANFQEINYDGVELNENSLITLESDCTAEYVSVLLFSKDTDYRQDPARAVINKAFPCPWQNKFSYTISFADLKNLPNGVYYAFLADQDSTGLWYNPR